MKIRAVKDNLPFNIQEKVRYAHDSDACIDLVTTKILNVPSGMWSRTSSGIEIELPIGCFGLILPRSGMASLGFSILGGVIDPGFRGEILITLMNNSKQSLRFPVGTRIAQLAVLPYFKANLEWVTNELSATDRGCKGHGSTGQ